MRLPDLRKPWLYKRYKRFCGAGGTACSHAREATYERKKAASDGRPFAAPWASIAHEHGGSNAGRFSRKHAA